VRWIRDFSFFSSYAGRHYSAPWWAPEVSADHQGSRNGNQPLTDTPFIVIAGLRGPWTRCVLEPGGGAEAVEVPVLWQSQRR